MVRPVVSEDFLLRRAPGGCTAAVGVLEADDVVDVSEATGFVGIEAYGGIWLVAAVFEVFAIILSRKRNCANA